MVVDSEDPPMAKHRGLRAQIQPEPRCQLIVHRQAERGQYMRFRFQRGGTPLAGAHLPATKSNGHSKPRQRDSLMRAKRRTKAEKPAAHSAGNTQCRPPHSHPNSRQATPTPPHLSLEATPRQRARAPPCGRNPASPRGRKPASTRTAARSEQQHRSTPQTLQTAGDKRPASHAPSDHITNFFKAARKPPPPKPTPPRSPTRTGGDQTSTPSRRTRRTPPNKLTVLTYNVRAKRALEGCHRSHRATPARHDGAHGNTCAQGKRRKDGSRKRSEDTTWWAACYLRGPPAG
jgi:pyruvate/2-oxoglutarate dehydrogenase complex dihydrolipoamide acyltransferase (E2) component